MGSVSYDFSGETIVVTGGSSGIGREIAFRFGDAGSHVIVADVQQAPKDIDTERPTHDRIRRTGGSAEFLQCDVSKPETHCQLVDRAKDHGGVDVYVNNAATYVRGSLEDITPEDSAAIYDVNVKGVLFGCQAASATMTGEDSTGTILNVESISSELATANQVLYNTTKGAVRMITRSVAFELADEGVRVNGIAPGQIATEIVDGRMTDLHKEVANDEYVKPIPIGRAGTPADVAGVALFLASDDASYVTGETVFVDGGWQIF